MIVLIVAAILGARKDAVLESGLQLLGAVLTTHTFGFLLGYLLGGLSGGFGSVARTTSIEVGMQNSGLGAVLAQAHFANPLTVIPSAISAITHCILGSASPPGGLGARFCKAPHKSSRSSCDCLVVVVLDFSYLAHELGTDETSA